ncbi:MAG: hydrogenase expression/formation protein [Rhodanobacter sp.]|jgi:hydrogenase-1 operon protein HyaF|nr:hydrogenase expression/formation protein [Rhodanobacter sp.]
MKKHPPFPIPVVVEPVETGEETLDYLPLPATMETYSVPQLPEPEAFVDHAAALTALDAVRAALDAVVAGDTQTPRRIDLSVLDAAERILIQQTLGEGEVSARIEGDGESIRIQEAVFAGVWRVLIEQDGRLIEDYVEVATVPARVRDAVRTGQVPAPIAPAEASQTMNAPALLAEIADHAAAWNADAPPHIINLSLLPLTPADHALLNTWTGSGRVVLLSRGYGNCRVSATGIPTVWRVTYYNSQDVVILDSIEIVGVPDVVCAAAEDFADSARRLRDVLIWMRPAEGIGAIPAGSV